MFVWTLTKPDQHERGICLIHSTKYHLDNKWYIAWNTSANNHFVGIFIWQNTALWYGWKSSSGFRGAQSSPLFRSNSEGHKQLLDVDKPRSKVCSADHWLYALLWSLFSKYGSHLRFVKHLIYSLHAKFSRGNINMYLYLMSFLHTDIPYIVEVLPGIRPGLTYFT